MSTMCRERIRQLNLQVAGLKIALEKQSSKAKTWEGLCDEACDQLKEIDEELDYWEEEERKRKGFSKMSSMLRMLYPKGIPN